VQAFAGKREGRLKHLLGQNSMEPASQLFKTQGIHIFLLTGPFLLPVSMILPRDSPQKAPEGTSHPVQIHMPARSWSG
jgi:hypothetical protein